MTDIPLDSFIENLDLGYSCEIIFMIRSAGKPGVGVFRNTVNRKAAVRIRSTAKKDFLTGRYVILSEGNRFFFDDPGSFGREFFVLRLPLKETGFNPDEEVLEIRAEADMLKRPSPLSILDPFFFSEIINTAWERIGDNQ